MRKDRKTRKKGSFLVIIVLIMARYHDSRHYLFRRWGLGNLGVRGVGGGGGG